MPVPPDFFTPSIIDLSSGNVQGVETSRTHPKVALDPTGVYATNADGQKEVQLRSGGGIQIPIEELGAWNGQRNVAWVDTVANLVVGYIHDVSDSLRNYISIHADSGAGKWAEVRAAAGRGGTHSAVEAQADFQMRTVLDDIGQSDFVQWNTGRSSRQVGLGVAQIYTAGGFNGAPAFIFPSLPAGRYYLALSASAYTTAVGTAYFDYYFDGAFIGTVTHYMNNALVHMPHATCFLDIGVQVAGTHYVQLATNPVNGTNSNDADRLGAQIIVM